MTQGSEHTTGGCPRGRDSVAARPDLLQVAVTESRPGVLVLRPVGEVDVASAPVLRDATRTAVAAAPRCVLVDLTGLTFCGSTGLVALMEARREADEAGVRFGTVDGPAIVRRVLEITQLGPALRHRETLDEALLELG